MTILTELAGLPGVMAVGEYSYRGDRFSHKGQLDDEQARMASIMCRATTMSVHMQSEILGSFSTDCGFNPARGWIVTGPRFAVCVVANVFCFLDKTAASLNDVLGIMRTQLDGAPSELV